MKTLQTAVNDLKRIIRTDVEEIYGESVELHIATPSICIDFFSMLPNSEDSDDIERLIDALDAFVSVNNKNRASQKRTLAQFDSYFLFNDIINDYWKSDIDREERLFFYPLYLWWQITGVLPLRPREFILTQRNCLEKRADGYYLTLRRNNLKGSKKKCNL